MTLALSRQPTMSVISNFIVISLFLNKLSLNLVYANNYIAQKLIVFVFFYKQEKLDSDFGHFLAKHVLRIGLFWEQGATYVPGDQKVYQMMCNMLTIKVTKFQQSSANQL